MKSTILEKIIASKRIRIEEAKRLRGPDELAASARETIAHRRDFGSAISKPGRINIIAEFKRASPSKGVINDSMDVVETARSYEKGGAAAISVLTEEDHFQGSLDDLRAVRAAVDLPILRKDFIVDEYQIYESAEAGADAILLIVSALTSENLLHFQKLAHDLGMETLVEVHNRKALEVAKSIGANIIGVNNRDLRSFEVTLDISRGLISDAPKAVIMVSESGLRSREDLIELRNIGYSAFLIGETLMRSGEPESELKKLGAGATELSAL
jgi:indole-3-glycerol phosphate synthase